MAQRPPVMEVTHEALPCANGQTYDVAISETECIVCESSFWTTLFWADGKPLMVECSNCNKNWEINKKS